MTMIAGFKLDETPFLIGDLITSVPDHLKGGRRRHEVKKKTAILSRNCAVGWTGSVLSAGMILDELFERFRNVEVARSHIEDFLKNREPDGSQTEVRLVIWVVEAEPSLFMWVSTSPAIVFEYEPIVAGSGEVTFTSLQSRLETIRFPQLGVMEKLAKALTHYSELLTCEVQEPDPTFGFAYEVAAFLDGKFGMRIADYTLLDPAIGPTVCPGDHRTAGWPTA